VVECAGFEIRYTVFAVSRVQIPLPPPRLIRTDSKSFEQFPIRSGPSKALLEHLPDQAGFLVGLNVLESVQDLPNDLQVRRPFADSAPALKARD
jgi:hypothetical protein